MRVLALDLGMRRIGLALSDEEGRVAGPLGTLETQGIARDVAAVAELAQAHGVELVVVGLPLLPSGEEGRGARRARRFAEELARSWSGRVETWDERLTSAEAERVLLEADLSRRKRRQVRDRVAATLILQSFLDAMR